MQKILTRSLFLAFLISSGTFAEENHGQGMNHQGMQQMVSAATAAQDDKHSGNVAPDKNGRPTQLTDGVVEKVDLKNGKVTLRHGDIANVMPAMTMAYRVRLVQQLEAIHAGDQVRFALNKLNNEYIVTHIEVAR